MAYGTNTVRKYDDALSVVWTGSVTGASSLNHLAVLGASLFATSPTAVYRINSNTGSFVSAIISSLGSGDGQISTPIGIATDGTYLYVGDAGNDRVQKFTIAGAYVTKWGSYGTGQGQFSAVQGVVCDDSGDVWVAEYGNNRLERFSNVGVYQDTIAQASPSGVGRGSGDVLWVSNPASNTVAKWDEAAAGYGGLAIDIGGSVSSYIGSGDRTVATGNVEFGTATGPGTCTIRAFGKSTSGTTTFRAVVLSAIATPRG